MKYSKEYNDSAVKDHKSNARARMGKTRENLGTNYLLSSGKTEGRRLKLVFLGPIFLTQVWLNLFEGVTYSARELSKFTTWQWISFYLKAFFFTNFKSWLWLICDLYFLSKKPLCHVHLISRAIEMLTKDFFNYPRNFTCKNINKGKQLILNKVQIIKTCF